MLSSKDSYYWLDPAAAAEKNLMEWVFASSILEAPEVRERARADFEIIFIIYYNFTKKYGVFKGS